MRKMYYWKCKNGVVITDTAVESYAVMYCNDKLLNALYNSDFNKVSELYPDIEKYLGNSETVNIDDLITGGLLFNALLVYSCRNKVSLEESKKVIRKYFDEYCKEREDKDTDAYNLYPHNPKESKNSNDITTIRKEINTNFNFIINGTEEEYNDFKRVLDHHIEYLLDLDEFPEIEAVVVEITKEEDL